tara:strand:- start:4773 stop:5885 length:1113 start_codon:yes stop_codon:yes gene_type:complete
MNLSDEIDNYLKNQPFGLNANEKEAKLLSILKFQIRHHLNNCTEYKNWYESNNFKDPDLITRIDEVPFIPSSVFKHLNLTSSSKKSKKITSSGTSSQLKSSIYIDSKTSLNQTKALSKILSHFLGSSRKSFFVVDYAPDKKNNNMEMSARFAGMSGYLIASKKTKYLLDQDYSNEYSVTPSMEVLKNNSSEEPIVIIGYTYMLWEFIRKLNNAGQKIELPKNSKIIHFGGWKKLANQSISKAALNEMISRTFNVQHDQILDIYGFTEQLGTIYVSQGNKGCIVSDYSSVLIRNTDTLEVLEDGKKGFLQFISVLPESYPGFSILNDDIGYISNRYLNENGSEVIEFLVESRLKKAEARGCGDTLPENYFL